MVYRSKKKSPVLARYPSGPMTSTPIEQMLQLLATKATYVSHISSLAIPLNIFPSRAWPARTCFVYFWLTPLIFDKWDGFRRSYPWPRILALQWRLRDPAISMSANSMEARYYCDYDLAEIGQEDWKMQQGLWKEARNRKMNHGSYAGRWCERVRPERGRVDLPVAN